MKPNKQRDFKELTNAKPAKEFVDLHVAPLSIFRISFVLSTMEFSDSILSNVNTIERNRFYVSELQVAYQLPSKTYILYLRQALSPIEARLSR